MATANPAMNDDVYQRAGFADAPANVMTLQGTAFKSMILVGILFVAAAYTWSQTMSLTNAEEGIRQAPPRQMIGLLAIGGIGGFITALITIFSPKTSPITAPIYAVLEGLVLGTISAFFETSYPGIVIQAVTLSMGVLIVLLMIYGAGLIRVTETFRIGVVAATGAVCVAYLINFVMGIFGTHLPFIHQTGWVGIGFSIVVVVIAAMNLILDFDFIAKGVQRGAPRYMEWYGGFSLLVTLVWMYLEILRLLAKLRDNRS